MRTFISEWSKDELDRCSVDAPYEWYGPVVEPDWDTLRDTHQLLLLKGWTSHDTYVLS